MVDLIRKKKTRKKAKRRLVKRGERKLFEKKINQYTTQVNMILVEHSTKLQREVFRLRTQGISQTQILRTLTADFNTVSPTGKRGGSIFRSLYREVEKKVEESIKDIERTAYHHRIGIIDISVDASGELTTKVSKQLVIWICALGAGGGPTCGDCLARNGEERTFTEWQGLGLPATGFSVCDNNCKCRLIPKGAPGRKPDPDKPIKLAAKKLRVAQGKLFRIQGKGIEGRRNTKEERRLLRIMGNAKNTPEVNRLIKVFKETKKRRR